jgi:hypothetical protein
MRSVPEVKGPNTIDAPPWVYALHHTGVPRAALSLARWIFEYWQMHGPHSLFAVCSLGYTGKVATMKAYVRICSLLLALLMVGVAPALAAKPIAEPTSVGKLPSTGPLALPGSFALQCGVVGPVLSAANGTVGTNWTTIGPSETFRLLSDSNGQYEFQTTFGTFLTATGGGGQTNDAIHIDATKIGDWEKFRIYYLGDAAYAIQTVKGNFLTCLKGNQTTNAIHTDATKVNDWEKFALIKIGDPGSGYSYAVQSMNLTGQYWTAAGGGGQTGPYAIGYVQWKVGDTERFKLLRQPDGTYAFQTAHGNFITAVGGGNQTNPASTDPPHDVLHTDATQIKAWEKFKVTAESTGWYEFQTFAGGYVGSGGGIRTNTKPGGGDAEWRLFFVSSLSGLAGSFAKTTSQVATPTAPKVSSTLIKSTPTPASPVKIKNKGN